MRDTILEVVSVVSAAVITLGAIGLFFVASVAYEHAREKDQVVQPQPSYLVRRVEMKLVDARANPDKSINPSYMVPNMRFTCVEESK